MTTYSQEISWQLNRELMTLRRCFNITVTKNVKEYLGCRIYMNRKGEITVHQPHIYKHLEDKFRDTLEMPGKKNTKNLPTKLFERHYEKLMSDVGFFIRCNTQLMGKA